MADQEKVTGGGPGSAPAPAVAPGNLPGQTGDSAAAVRESVVRAGGSPTGRKSEFKFPVETPEGQAERREHERLRKAARRARERQTQEPPVIPSADDTPSPQIDGQDSGAVPPAGAPVAETVVPWTAADVRDFTDELVEMSEARRLSQFCAMARQAKLPESLVRDIERTSKYPPKTKDGLKACVAGCAAKWLTKSGLSPKNKEEAALVFYMTTVAFQGRRLRSQLEELIRQDKKHQEEKEK